MQVVVRGDTVLAQTADALRQALAREARLAVVDGILISRQQSSTHRSDLMRAQEDLDAAERHYTRLEPQVALTRTAKAAERLRARLDEARGPPALARALRLRGLTFLFLQKPEEAARSFASASFLDPKFSPAAREWPPEARRAYADSIAGARRIGSGVLSVRVAPEVARVWLDGRPIGIGSTTAQRVEPGEHFLLVTCPGYQRFAGVVAVDGAGKVSQASVYLEPEDASNSLAAGALVHAMDGAARASVLRQVAAVLDVDLILLVAPGADGREGAPPVAILLGADGAMGGDPITIGDIDATATAIVSSLFSVEQPVVEPATAWYRKWWVWAAAGGGAVLVGGAILAILVDR